MATRSQSRLKNGPEQGLAARGLKATGRVSPHAISIVSEMVEVGTDPTGQEVKAIRAGSTAGLPPPAALSLPSTGLRNLSEVPEKQKAIGDKAMSKLILTVLVVVGAVAAIA